MLSESLMLTLHEDQKADGVLTRLSDYHFSTKTLPSRSNSLKKYMTMMLSAGGGLGYWSATDKYNQNHHLSGFIAESNIICVTAVTGLFLLQSVDLARNYLDQLAGSVPSELSEIIETLPSKQRRAIRLKTGLASSISGFPFLIIGIKDSLPLITDHASGAGEAVGTGIWASYFYIVNVGLHILPFALLQHPDFNYYLWPVTACYHGVKRLIKKPDENIATLDREIAQIQQELQSLQSEVRNQIANRLSSTLTQFFEKANQVDLEGIFFSEMKGLDRLRHVLQTHPPLPAPPAPSRGFQRFLRLFGAQLELGAAFIWWTNIFPTLYAILKPGMNPILAGTLAALLGLTPSYVLFILLSFFGESQFPRLIHYVTNAVKKLMGYPDTHALFPSIAHARPLLFASGVTVITYLSFFSPVNAISLNEEQYQDNFSSEEMTVLEVYADIGIPIMAFISLLDLFSNYLTEISAVFNRPGSFPQLRARLLLTQEHLLADLMRSSPQRLIEELKELKNEDMALLMGADKDKHWLTQHEASIEQTKTRLTEKKAEKASIPSINASGQNQIPASPALQSGILSLCCAALFSPFSSCLRRCRRSPEEPKFHPLLQ